MSEKILGAAIFGAGWVAGEHARAYQACERTKLVAVGSRREESARHCARFRGRTVATALDNRHYRYRLLRPSCTSYEIWPIFGRRTMPP